MPHLGRFVHNDGIKAEQRQNSSTCPHLRGLIHNDCIKAQQRRRAAAVGPARGAARPRHELQQLSAGARQRCGHHLALQRVGKILCDNANEERQPQRCLPQCYMRIPAQQCQTGIPLSNPANSPVRPLRRAAPCASPPPPPRTPAVPLPLPPPPSSAAACAAAAGPAAAALLGCWGRASLLPWGPQWLRHPLPPYSHCRCCCRSAPCCCCLPRPAPHCPPCCPACCPRDPARRSIPAAPPPSRPPAAPTAAACAPCSPPRLRRRHRSAAAASAAAGAAIGGGRPAGRTGLQGTAHVAGGHCSGTECMLDMRQFSGLNSCTDVPRLECSGAWEGGK